MNDQAKKLRELAQKIREERDRASLIFDPMARKSEKTLPGRGIIPKEYATYAKPEPEKTAPEKPASERIGSAFARIKTESNRAAGLVQPTSVKLPPTEQIFETTAPISSPSVTQSPAPTLDPQVIPPIVPPLDIPATPPAPAPKPDTKPTPQTSATRVIAVTSGKGGVGKSNLVANLGIALAKRGRKVMLFDADLGLANIDVLFGINPKYHLKNLVDGDKSLQEILVKGPYSLKIVPGGSGIPELANLSDEQQQKLLESFSELEREYEITLIDTGAGISKDIISFVLAAREAIIITTPEPTAITDAYGMIKVLTQRDSGVDIKLVVNMVSDEKEGQDIANRIIMATKQFLGKRIEVLGYILSDPTVNISVVKQKPLVIGYPNSKASKCIMQIAEQIDKSGRKDRSQIAGRNGFRGFLSRLFER
ncbi:MAG: MinD/ParA family protein [Firmicutes bacterium]|nr:MinD/ParA family protein [Bacillota bacterium]